ncbi:sodium-coupled neutral amino acid transporter 7-like isoform X2 [Haemaphysalis longicornis]
MCGQRWRNAAAASVLVTCYGVCITYLIVIGDQYDRIFASFHGPHFCHTWYMSREFTISVTAVVLVLPLSMLPRMEFLQYASTLGIVAVLYPCILTLMEYFSVSRSKDVHVKNWPTSLYDVLLSMPVFCFAYQSHEIAISAYAALRERSLCKMAKATVCSMVLLMVVYCMVGSFGYLAYGSAVRADVMEMFDANQSWVLVGLVALILKMAVTYPLMALCARDAIDKLYLELRGKQPPQPEDSARRHARRRKISLAWFALTVGCSLLPLDIGVAIQFLGCLAALNIFVFPGMCLVGYSKHKSADNGHRHMLLGSCMVLAGAAFFAAILLHIVFVELTSERTHRLCS